MNLSENEKDHNNWKFFPPDRTGSNNKNPKVYKGRAESIRFTPWGEWKDFSVSIYSKWPKPDLIDFQSSGADLTAFGQKIDTNDLLKLIIDTEGTWNVEIHTEENSYRPVTVIHFTKGDEL